MKQIYQVLGWLVAALCVLSAPVAQAQSGPYGNEWIVPGQQYYKIKVARDGLYRLDYQYLQQAGIRSADPTRLQLWRRGKEVAIHVGGNTAALDATTFVEFFGQRNDGVLDRNMYQDPGEQTHMLYSLYTDTAAYFLTVSPTTAGKRMARPQATAGAPHAVWQQQVTRIQNDSHSDVNETDLVYRPWLEAGEGFLSSGIGFVNGAPLGGATPRGTFVIDSLESVAATGAAPLLEIVVVGGVSNRSNTGAISVISGSGERQLATFSVTGYSKVVGRYPIQRSDIGANGKLTVKVALTLPATQGVDFVRVGYIRVIHPQTRRWIASRTGIAFRTDSTLTGPATYTFDTIPASVVGYDVTDAGNVRRIESQVSGSSRQFVFPDTDGRTHYLRLHDANRLRQPLPAQLVRLRPLSPAANFLIISARGLMQPTSDGSMANPVNSYAAYRASVQGGRYDTLSVATEQLYDQFHYGEKSPMAIRQFAQWVMATGGTKPRYLLLLGKGYIAGERINGRFHRTTPPSVYRASPDYVPSSTRAGSDIFFTADWPNKQYLAKMFTGRVAAQTPDHIRNYLLKLQEHEALGLEPWRRNVLLMAGGQKESENIQFNAYAATYGRIMKRPFFNANIVQTIQRSDYPGQLTTPVQVNITPEVNAGLSIISYFGHGSTRQLDVRPLDLRLPASGYANKGKYPVLFVSGCAAGSSFTGDGSIAEDWILAADKGGIGFTSSSTFDVGPNMYALDELTFTLLLNDPQWYGKPIVEVQSEALRRLEPRFNSSGNLYGIATLMSTTWQGDPALALFSPPQPDFQTADNRLQISPAAVAPQPGTAFSLKLGVSNPGKITTGPLAIRVTRTVGSSTTTVNFSVPQARQDTTYTLALTNPATGSVAGQNTFQVDLDPDNLIAELDETNNRATLIYSFLTGGVTTLSPPEFAIVGSPNVRLVAQSNVPTSTSREYDLELDTTQTFATPLLRTRLSAVMVPEWTPTLPATSGQDSVVWYWRVRLHDVQGDESPEWAVSSFRVINGRTQGGWSQSHPGQFRRDERNGVEVAVPGGQWAFDAARKQATVTSTRIGPARQWETLYHTIRTSSTGGYTLRLLGIDTLGNTVELNPNVTNTALPLSAVSAKTYPYLQLEATLTDATAGTTPQLEQWLVTYQGVPEGVVRPSATPLAAADLTQQAQKTGKVTIEVPFQNVADFDFEAPLVGYIVLRSNTGGAPRERFYPLANPALTAHTQQTFPVTLDVRGLSGMLSGEVVLNPRRQPELNYFNNQLSIPAFEVINNDTPPVLDVAFDGRHLLNGEIVSPQPIISVQLRDIDKLRPITDRNNFLLVLTRPGGAGTAVNLNDAGIVFVADSAQGTARLEYQPGKAQPLEAGVYTLEVQGRDGAGNLAGSEPYRITFEVITNSSITHVFPYPNPVTSKTKFVFTLTGSTPPRNMKIQIVSLTGRVVKEIMMADMGPLRIGNNMTEYAWDGTDDFGDRLANGTYLYRVVLDDPDGEFKQRKTGADRAFQKDWGKLVLLK
ncbi:hypothetical protein KLP40_05775 [Hymenobacter sp. NST-14]|uniref:putative type IX secretion system sortase PorU2 n=1 Tax=Hymenobacter piscis TaxID=2839984 RepID=UPI001C0284DE|nr:C25 family cysteine peptidase [Hymenobacter piscis]MBT9392666.1 hypothetical protein [Hymenobacter piscis]